MSEHFDEQQFNQFLEQEYLSQQEEAQEAAQDRLHERAFARELLSQGMPIASLVEKLEENSDVSILGLQLTLGQLIEQFIIDHPDVNDINALYGEDDVTLAAMVSEHAHCKILYQFESVYRIFQDMPDYPDLLKEVQYEIIGADILDEAQLDAWNSIAQRYISGPSINMQDPESDPYVIAKRAERDQSYNRFTANTYDRQEIYELLRENGDALGIKTHDNTNEFLSKVATAIIYGDSPFRSVLMEAVYETGEKLGMTTDEIETTYRWTYDQVRRTW